MPKRSGAKAARRYHDRVAGRYDATYDNDSCWAFYREVTWRNLRRHLPTDLSARVLDVGAGTGLWGLRLAKSGYRVTLTDISPKMLDQARRKADEQGLLGKTVLPTRRFRAILEDPKTFDLLLSIEESLHGEESLLGCASHLEIAAQAPER